MKISVLNDQPEGILLISFFRKNELPATTPVHFKAEKGELWWFSADQLWIGLGDQPGLSSIRKTVRKVFHNRKDQWPEQLAVDVRGQSDEWVENMISGILLGGYKIGLYKSGNQVLCPLYEPEGVLHLLTDHPEEYLKPLIEQAEHTVAVQSRIMDLINAPGNKKPPRVLASWALTSGEQFGYNVKVLDKEELYEQGFAALLAVNQGSDEEPALIVCDYAPENYQTTVALVGKGITFDTGGISIKPSANMHLMKSDMGGAAAVLGVVELAARLKMPVRLIGIIPSTENCIDGKSVKPGDVIGSYAGKTIEVIDTDAEGRLVLADGLSYAVRQYQPDVVIDLATLTGSVIQTLGYAAAGLFTANTQLAEQLILAGEQTGEKVWPLPLWDDYAEEIVSEIADVKNFHGKPLAGAIVAAKFLEVFTDKHPAWVHLDIAGMAFGDQDLFPGRAGTAYGVRLLYQYLKNLSPAH